MDNLTLATNAAASTQRHAGGRRPLVHYVCVPSCKYKSTGNHCRSKLNGCKQVPLSSDTAQPLDSKTPVKCERILVSSREPVIMLPSVVALMHTLLVAPGARLELGETFTESALYWTFFRDHGMLSCCKLVEVLSSYFSHALEYRATTLTDLRSVLVARPLTLGATAVIVYTGAVVLCIVQRGDLLWISETSVYAGECLLVSPSASVDCGVRRLDECCVGGSVFEGFLVELKGELYSPVTSEDADEERCRKCHNKTRVKHGMHTQCCLLTLGPLRRCTQHHPSVADHVRATTARESSHIGADGDDQPRKRSKVTASVGRPANLMSQADFNAGLVSGRFLVAKVQDRTDGVPDIFVIHDVDLGKDFNRTDVFLVRTGRYVHITVDHTHDESAGEPTCLIRAKCGCPFYVVHRDCPHARFFTLCLSSICALREASEYHALVVAWDEQVDECGLGDGVLVLPPTSASPRTVKFSAAGETPAEERAVVHGVVNTTTLSCSRASHGNDCCHIRAVDQYLVRTQSNRQLFLSAGRPLVKPEELVAKVEAQLQKSVSFLRFPGRWPEGLRFERNMLSTIIFQSAGAAYHRDGLVAAAPAGERCPCGSLWDGDLFEAAMANVYFNDFAVKMRVSYRRCSNGCCILPYDGLMDGLFVFTPTTIVAHSVLEAFLAFRTTCSSFASFTRGVSAAYDNKGSVIKFMSETTLKYVVLSWELLRVPPHVVALHEQCTATIAWLFSKLRPRRADLTGLDTISACLKMLAASQTGALELPAPEVNAISSGALVPSAPEISTNTAGALVRSAPELSSTSDGRVLTALLDEDVQRRSELQRELEMRQGCPICGDDPELAIFDGTPAAFRLAHYLGRCVTDIGEDEPRYQGGAEYRQRVIVSGASRLLLHRFARVYCHPSGEAVPLTEGERVSMMAGLPAHVGTLASRMTVAPAERSLFEHKLGLVVLDVSTCTSVCFLAPLCCADLLQVLGNNGTITAAQRSMLGQTFPSLVDLLLLAPNPLRLDFPAEPAVSVALRDTVKAVVAAVAATFAQIDGDHGVPRATEHEHDVSTSPVNESPFLAGAMYFNPQLRRRGTYPLDTNPQGVQNEEDSCSKSFGKHKKLTAGIITCFCQHGLCLGFHIMRRAESVNDIFTVLLTRFKRCPRTVIYDFACGLADYCIARRPAYFKNTRFFIDRFHAICNHSGCSEIFKLVDVDIWNTEVQEQCNATIKLLRPQASQMSQTMFMLFYAGAFWVWNTAKYEKIRVITSIATRPL